MDQFTLFPKLPLELRGKVWDEVCSEPRIVEVEIKAYQDPNFSSSSYGFLPRTLNPAVLYVCVEARKHGLKYYTRCFWNSEAGDGTPDTFIYLNHQFDKSFAFQIQARTCPSNHLGALRSTLYGYSVAHGKDVELIQRMALPRCYGWDAFDCAWRLNRFIGLRELVLVYNWNNEPNVAQKASSNNYCSGYRKTLRLMEPGIDERAQYEAALNGMRIELDEMAAHSLEKTVAQPLLITCKRFDRA
jgi:hypothetical protein